MGNNIIPMVPPSGTPAAAAPATPAAPSAPAPVAAAAQPQTLNDYAELARQSLAQESPASPEPPAAVPGSEPSPEPAAADPAQPEPQDPAPHEGDEPTADEQANWTEGEKRIHGALQRERAERKAAKAENAALKDRLAQIEARLTPPAPTAEPAVPAVQNTPVPSTELLADCQTFEAVDAKAQAAAATESTVVRLQNMLARNGHEAVATRLAASGVKEIAGVPIAEASADSIGDFLATVYEGARLTQAQAPSRKGWLSQNQNSLAEAVRILPQLGDRTTPEFQAVAKMVRENPLLRNRADWPVVVAKQYLGAAAWEKLNKPAAAAPTAPAPAAPAPRVTRTAPGAPRRTTAAMPQPAPNAALAAKIADGTASLAEVTQYTRSFVSV